MSTASDPRTWTERELTHAWRELMTAWREEVDHRWPAVLKMVIAEMMVDATGRIVDADVTTEERRAAFNKAQGELELLKRLMLPGFGLEDRLKRLLEKVTR